MKAPNKFVSFYFYANPALWTKFFRKEQIAKKFYKFTYHKTGSADTLQISINGKDYVTIADGESFKLHTNDTLKYKFGDSLKDSYTFECFVGDTETAANVFSVPGETSLVNTFRPADCTQETTKISGTITKDIFKTLPSGTELSFKAKALEVKSFNFTIAFESGMPLTGTVQVKRSSDTDYVTYNEGDTFALKENETIVSKAPANPMSMHNFHIKIVKDTENPALFKVPSSTTLSNYFRNEGHDVATDQSAMLVSESFEKGYSSGETFTLYYEVDGTEDKEEE